MTIHPATAGDDPRRLLSSTRGFVRDVRRAQRATWFPLLVLATVTYLAIPFSTIEDYTRTCKVGGLVPGGHLEACVAESNVMFIYWPIALLVAYAAIAVFYFRRSANRGVGSPIRPYVVAGIVLAIVLTGVSLWGVHHPLLGNADIAGVHLSPRDYTRVQRLASPAAAIGLGLLVLTRVERSLLLGAVAIGYLYVVLAPVTFGWSVMHARLTPATFATASGHFSRWVGLPHLVIDGAYLLIAAIGFALAQRSNRAALLA